MEEDTVDSSNKFKVPQTKPVPKVSCLKRLDILAGQVLEEVFLSGNMSATLGLTLKHSSIGSASEHGRKLSAVPVNVTWQSRAGEAAITCLGVINILLRGISQVYLCNHPITGFFICIGLGLSSTKLLIHALVGTACSTIGATILALPETNYIVSGLCGYDGALTGCAVHTFLRAAASSRDTFGAAFSNNGLAITAVLSAVSGVVHMSCRNMNDLPALTLSFNICVMCLLLSLTDHQSNLTSLNWEASDDDGLGEASHWGTANTIGFVHDATIRGVGQFIFVDTTLGGWFVIMGLAISSRWAAATTVLGSFIGYITARYILVVPAASLYLVRSGLYGYSSAGTCCAIAGGVFYHANFYSFGIAIFAAGFTVLIKMATDAILKTDGLQLPSLTIPFVVTTWLVMLAKSVWLDSIAGEGEDMDDVRFINFDNAETYGQVIQRLLDRSAATSWKGHDAGEMKRRGFIEKAVLKKVDSIRRIIPMASRENSRNMMNKTPSFDNQTFAKMPLFNSGKTAHVPKTPSHNNSFKATPDRQELNLNQSDPSRKQNAGATAAATAGASAGDSSGWLLGRAGSQGSGSHNTKKVYVTPEVVNNSDNKCGAVVEFGDD